MFLTSGNSLVVQWLGLGASIAGVLGSIPGRGTKILQKPCSAAKNNNNNNNNNNNSYSRVLL